MKCNERNQYSNENGIRIFHGISSIMMTMIWSIIMVLHLKGDPHIQMVEGFIAPLSTAKYCSKNNYILPSNVFMVINEDNDSNSENKDNEKENKSNNSNEDAAAKLREQAAQMREQAAQLEATLGPRRSFNQPVPSSNEKQKQPPRHPLSQKTILVIGANGRLGSMVTRYLLRAHPDTQVRAAVHYVGSSSTRGYGRLSYEVGAEDGAGSIGPAWSSVEDRNASFEYTEDMAGYNLQNLRVVEVELLDPVQCGTLTEDVDAVIWCATDFNGNKPRAVSGLDVAFLFRAVASPTKGRVEIEGLMNVLGGLKNGLRGRKEENEEGPCKFVLVSAAPDAFDDFVTPFGDFKALKRDGERIVDEEFPSLSHTILQMARYDENFVEEGLDVIFEDVGQISSDLKNDDDDDDEQENSVNKKKRRRINRRDAARAVVDALTNDNLLGKKVEVYTVER